jgi:hypothetical protein
MSPVISLLLKLSPDQQVDNLFVGPVLAPLFMIENGLKMTKDLKLISEPLFTVENGA